MIHQLLTKSNVFIAILVIGFLCAANGGLVGLLGVPLGMLVGGAIVTIWSTQEDDSTSWQSVPPLR